MTTAVQVDPSEEQSVPDLDAFDPAPEYVDLADGTRVRVLSLKTRQFLRLLRIVTHGAGNYLMRSGLSLQDPLDVFVGKLMGLLVVAVPESEDAVIDFILSIVEPEGLHVASGRPMSREQLAENEQMFEELRAKLFNPELEDTFSILEAVVQREGNNIQSLGKRLQAMFKIAQRTGQIPTSSSDDEQ